MNERPPRMAATRAASSVMNTARNESRYGRSLRKKFGFFLPIQCEPGTYSTNVNGPVPITFFL